jgi:hypothetical protein
MITQSEALSEDLLLTLYEEHSQQGIAEFQAERLQSYFLAHPDVAQPAIGALAEARSLYSVSPRAVLILASTASEVGLKSVLLRPIVHGLVHDESLAGLITDLVASYQPLERFHKLLSAVLLKLGGIDLTTYTRAGAQKTLWEEIRSSREYRNEVVHRARSVDIQAAQHALDIASTVLDLIFPAVIGELGLHLHDDMRLCADHHIPDELARALGLDNPLAGFAILAPPT